MAIFYHPLQGDNTGQQRTQWGCSSCCWLPPELCLWLCTSPGSQGHALHHLHQPMVRARNACSQVLHFTPQAPAEQGAHHEASTSSCSKALQPGEQQFAPNIPKRCSWDHGAPGRLMKCKALSSAHINQTGLVPVLFKASFLIPVADFHSFFVGT